MGLDALAPLNTNRDVGHFTVQNSRNFTTVRDFSNAGSVTIDFNSMFATPSAGTYTQTGTVIVERNGTLDLAGPFLNVADGRLTGGTYVIRGTFRFQDADIRTNAAIIVLDGAGSGIIDRGVPVAQDGLRNFAINQGSFTVLNGRDFTTAGDFHNDGTLGIGASSTFTVNGALVNFSGTTLTGGTYVVGGTFQFTGADVQTNAATVVLDGPAAMIVDESYNDALAHFAANAAAGSFTVQNGLTFTIAGDFCNDGTLTVAAASTVTVSGTYSQGGTLNVLPGGTMCLTGDFANLVDGTLTGGTYLIGGTFKFTGPGVVTNEATIVLDGQDAQILAQSGTVDGLANFTVNAPTGSFTVWSGRSFTTGAFTNEGSVTVGAGSTFTISGTYSQTGGSTVLAGGTLGVVGGLVDLQGGTLSGSGTINGNVRNGASVSIGAALLTVTGSYQQTGGITTLQDGTLTVAGGLLDLQGGTLTGSGTINGVVRNGAHILLGTPTTTGVLTVNGNYTQTADGVLDIKIGGPNPGSGYDQLRVNGHATLGGCLNVHLINGYVPIPETEFKILWFEGRDGTFDPACVNVDPSLTQPIYTDTDVTVVAR
jgi:hypothetical protein